MSVNFELSVEVSEQYNFNEDSLSKIQQNTWVKNQWPLVYFIQNDKVKLAYVGESTNAYSRIKNHLANSERRKLDKISIIGSDKFNKSATLDIESKLIQYLTAEGTYELQNGNYGLINHQYFQQDLYKNLFNEIWSKLLLKRIVTKSLQEIENSEIFKYSPYKSLNEDQYNSVIDILKGLTSKKSNQIFVSGSAGTGKTILATYLVKLLTTSVDNIDFEELNEEEVNEIRYIIDFRQKYPRAKIGLVIAMTSLRKSLEMVFSKTPGLKKSMILSPSDTFGSNEKYDLLIVDEAHRLRKYKNIGWRGVFKKNNQKLGLDDTGTELDWIIANSKNQIFFYDSAQSVKPSDVDEIRFHELLSNKYTLKYELKSQMRVKGGNNYIKFVDDLLNVSESITPFTSEDYDLKLFDSFSDFISELERQETKYGLCRIVAGYSWEWKSDPKKKNPQLDAIDIEIDGYEFQWNQTDSDWVNNPKDKTSPLKEIGCIHTVQGYDLNYTGVIFGREINYNPQTKEIEINSDLYFDSYGKIGTSQEELKAFIINIYKTLLYRGIRGTYIYVYHNELKEYFKKHINIYQKEIPFRILAFDKVKPYVNAIPLIDIQAAAGTFSEQQKQEELTWVEPPLNIMVKEGYFICQVVGESMNKIIPNGSYCLFREYDGGTREGSIVLAESTEIQDSEFGSGYTVKEYHSSKYMSVEEWRHKSIILKPLSNNDVYQDLVLLDDQLTNFKIIGIFIKVIEN